MEPTASPNASAGTSAASTGTDYSHSELRLPTTVNLLLAIAAGAVFFAVYQAVFPIYDVPIHLLRMFPSDEDAVAREVAKDWARVVHAAAGLSILGLLLGALLGTGEALTRKFSGIAFVNIVGGAILGAILGGVGGLLGSKLAIRLEPMETVNPMARTVISHAVMLGLLGLGVGLAVGLAAGSRRLLTTCAGAGLMSAIMAAMLFPIVCGLGLPSIQTDSVIPDGSGGVFGVVSKSGTIGIAVWIGFIVVALGLIRPIVNRRKPSSKRVAKPNESAAVP